MKTILTSAALAASVLLAANTAHAQQIPIDVSRVIRPIVGETDAYRAGRGVPPLVQSVPLMQAAQQYAEFLARTNTTGHTADGRSVRERIVATNAYKPCFQAENVFEYWSQPNVPVPPTVVSAAMQFWKNSPGHEANLRDVRARHIGVGVAAWTHSGRHYYKVVQVFGDDCAASSAGLPIPPYSSDIYVPGKRGGADAIRLASAAPCKQGFVWRAARPNDAVCVEPQSRARVAAENRSAIFRVQPGGGAYGPNTCLAGYVWREAFSGDTVCVTPAVRTLVREENRMQAMRVQLAAGG